MTILTSKKVLLPAITTCTLPSNHAKYLQISLIEELDYLQSQLMNDGKHACWGINYLHSQFYKYYGGNNYISRIFNKFANFPTEPVVKGSLNKVPYHSGGGAPFPFKL